jgi:hypothetical protein
MQPEVWMSRPYVCLILLAIGIALPPGCKKKPTGPDLTNPKAAAITFARAMESGDVETAKNSSIAGGMEVDLVEAMTHATASLRKLGSACRDKFGEASNSVMKEAGGVDASVALQDSTIEFDGEEAATVTPHEGKVVVPVRLVEGSWKVDIGALIKGDDITNSIPLLKTVGTAAEQLTPEVVSGKYKTPQEVKLALQRKMMELTGRGIPVSVFPTSQPTTLPAVPPPAP